MNASRPLTEFQKSIWRGQLLHNDAPLYNMIFTFDIKGSLDKEIFEHSFNRLVESTDSLRAIVDDNEIENPKQVISNLQGSLDFISFPPDQTGYNEWLEEKNKINFNLKESSYYSALIKFSQDHYVWYINQHHLFCDAYVFQLLLDRLSDIYSQLKSDKQPVVENITVREEKEVKNDKTPSSKASKEKSNLSLYAQNAISFRDTKANRIELDVPRDFIEKIQGKIGALQLNTFAPNLDLLSFLMSTLLILLKQIGNGNQEIQISNIFSTRVSSGDKKSFHPFLKIHNSNISIADGSTFTDVYALVRSFLISQSSDEAVAGVAPSIISNMFHLEMGQFAEFETIPKWHHCDHVDHHHFIRFHIFKYRSSGLLNLAFDLKEEFFQNGIEKKFASDYLNLIRILCNSNVDNLIDQICLVPPSELEELQHEIEFINQDDFSIESSLLKIIESKVDENLSNPALYYNDEVISYGMMRLCANNVSAYLEENNLIEKKNIVLYLPRSPQYIYSLLGVLNTGNSFIPVPASYPKERLKFIANEVNADLIIHLEDYLETQIPQLSLVDFDFVNEQNKNRLNTFSNKFYTLFTSGSTGKPKGVPITHESISNYINGIKDQYLEANAEYHMPLFTSIGFDLTMTSIFLPLATGGSISIYSEESGIDLSVRKVIKDQNINCYKCTPSHLKLVEGEDISGSVKSIIVGGENFTRQSCLRLYHQYGAKIKIINEYGPTEATVGCIAYQFDADEYHDHLNVVIGKPLRNHFAFISNSSGIPLPKGAIGELCIGGKGLAESYLNNEKQTLEKFVDGNEFIKSRFYKTGDLARINDQGDFEFFGRNDEQISIGGIRIEKGEIENVLKQHDDVNECVVVYSTAQQVAYSEDYIHCVKCGLPSNYPEAEFNEENICRYCQSYDSYSTKVEKYFKSPEDFKEILDIRKSENSECFSRFKSKVCRKFCR